MKKFNKKAMIFILILIAMVVLTGCQRNTDENGITLAEKIIALDTPWQNAMSEGFLSAILVWPLAQAINLVDSVCNNCALSILLVTIAFTLLTLPLSIKSTVSTQKMQLIQPKMQEIQDKYAGRDDEASKMQQAQEMQALYTKNGINPIGSLVTPFLQFPILIAMYYAVQRAKAVCDGTIAGIPFSTTPKAAIGDIANKWPILVVFVLMIVAQFVSSKVPTWLADAQRKKEKNYKQYADKQTTNNSMNTTMLLMVGMVGFIGFSWPIAMSLYWLINSLTNTLKTIYIQKRFVENA